MWTSCPQDTGSVDRPKTFSASMETPEVPRLYFDHAATTPLAPEVLDAMMPWLSGAHGNPSSLHASGRMARHAVEDARSRIARICGVATEGVVFTGSGTEADNLAVLGVAARRQGTIITSMVEHEAVLHPVQRLESEGRGVVRLRPRADGSIDPDAVADAIDGSVALVTLMHTNNETGAVTDTRAVGRICDRHEVPVHVDAVQALPWHPVTPEALGADLVTVSAHKIGGPKGVGALLLRGSAQPGPQILGGSQERGRRAGTENVAGIVGFAAALERVERTREAAALRMRFLSDRLRAALSEGAGPSYVPVRAGDPSPHIVYGFVRGGADAEMLVLRLDLEGVEASSGSACSSGALERGHVPRALGVPGAPLRLSIGPDTTEAEVDRCAAIVCRVVEILGSPRRA